MLLQRLCLKITWRSLQITNISYGSTANFTHTLQVFNDIVLKKNFRIQDGWSKLVLRISHNNTLRVWQALVFLDTGFHDMNWIDLTLEKDTWRPLVNTVMNLRVPYNARNSLIRSGIVSFSGQTLLHSVTSAWWAGYVDKEGETLNAHWSLVGRSLRKRPLGRLRRWNDKIKMNLGKWGHMNEWRMELTKDYVKWQTSVLMGRSLQFKQPARTVLLGLCE